MEAILGIRLQEAFTLALELVGDSLAPFVPFLVAGQAFSEFEDSRFI